MISRARKFWVLVLIVSIPIGILVWPMLLGSDSAQEKETERAAYRNWKSDVEMNGCALPKGPVYRVVLKNENSFPVRIRRVEQGLAGERTDLMSLVAPHDQLEFVDTNAGHAFYIYTKEGGLIGFMRAACPENWED